VTAGATSRSEVEGRVCVVTGAGRGIGASIAEALAREGGRIAILDRDAALPQTCQRRLEAAGADVRSYEVDVADEGCVVVAAERVMADFGGVDVLVNNAGISRLGPSMTFPTADWCESFDVMSTGVFLCCREFGKLLRQNGGGVIINIASINGIVAFPIRLAYSAAKAGVISITKLLAVEWAGYGIRVNAVVPGMTETEMLQDAINEGLIDVDVYMQHTPLRRFAKPQDIAEAVLFLASERSGYLTGQVIVPDIGWTAFGWIPWSGDPEAPGISRL
jgi:NAD(P)-dependent dehydrogenase (short-subunit alcohol dehydrogenase family)